MATATSKTVSFHGWFKTTQGYRQPKPYVEPLQYASYGTSTDDPWINNSGAFATNSLGLVQGSVADNRFEARSARARAYDKIVSKLRGSANAMLAVNVAEKRQSLDMIAKRAGQLFSAYKAIKKGDVSGSLKALGFKQHYVRKKRTWVRTGKGRSYTIDASRVDKDEYLFRKKLKTSSKLWLEYWFGWSPLVHDVYSAVEVLQDLNIDLQRQFTGYGSAEYYKQELVPPWEYQGYRRSSSWTWSASFGCRYQARLVCTSPNYKKASDLGLINPATVLWELIPFSFAVDWFLPVGKFLESYTDLVGISVDRVIQSERRTSSYTSLEAWTYLWYTPNPSGTRRVRDTAFSFQRLIPGTLPIPGILDRRGTAIGSLTRAATAISLLTSGFKTSKWS